MHHKVLCAIRKGFLELTPNEAIRDRDARNTPFVEVGLESAVGKGLGFLTPDLKILQGKQCDDERHEVPQYGLLGWYAFFPILQCAHCQPRHSAVRTSNRKRQSRFTILI